MVKSTRRGMGKGCGTGYKNLVHYDKHVHMMAGKGVKTYQKLNACGMKTLKGYARGNLNSFPLDSEYSIVAYSEGTRNGFRHVATLMRNGYEVDKASANYLNRTWEEFDFQSVIHKLLDKQTNLPKAKQFRDDIDRKKGYSLNRREEAERMKEFEKMDDEYIDVILDNPQTCGINPEEEEGRLRFKALEKVAQERKEIREWNAQKQEFQKLDDAKIKEMLKDPEKYLSTGTRWQTLDRKKYDALRKVAEERSLNAKGNERIKVREGDFGKDDWQVTIDDVGVDFFTSKKDAEKEAKRLRKNPPKGYGFNAKGKNWVKRIYFR